MARAMRPRLLTALSVVLLSPCSFFVLRISGFSHLGTGVLQRREDDAHRGRSRRTGADEMFKQGRVSAQKRAAEDVENSLPTDARVPENVELSNAAGSDSESMASDPLDTALSVLTSDVGSIALGFVGLFVIVAARLVIQDQNEGFETRISLLAVLATGTVLLNGLTKLDVQTKLAPTVELDGVKLSSPQVALHDQEDSARQDVEWSLSALLAATPASTVCLLLERQGNWTLVAHVGIVPESSSDQLPLPVKTKSPILDRYLNQDEPLQQSYLPALQTLPGRFELTYLPHNAQACVLVPVRAGCVLALGANRAKCFTPRHKAWAQRIATRLSEAITEPNDM